MSMSPPPSPKPLRPILCRVGSKARFAKMLNAILPPHDIYVEPFVGSGAVFFYKDPVQKEVINDLNTQVAGTYKLIQKVSTDEKEYPDVSTLEKAKAFWKQQNENPSKKPEVALTFAIATQCGGWMSRQVDRPTAVVKAIPMERRLKNMELYQDRLKGVIVRNQDYEKVMREFDSPKTLFFCDPPYEGTSEGIGYAQQNEFDFQRFAKVCSSMKGKVLITINDSKNLRDLFKGFYVQGVLIVGHKRTDLEHPTIGSKDRKELLISNFPLPAGWEKQIPNNLKVGSGIKRKEFYKQYNVPEKSYSLEELSTISKVPMSILQEVYDRGIGAYTTNPQSVRLKGSFVKNVDAPMSAKLSKEQWAMARVYSFLVGGEHDEDLRKKGSGFSSPKFSMTKTQYLTEAKRRAKEAGYKEPLFIADDEDHKLMLKKPTGEFVYFGKLGYGDYLLWSHAEGKGEVPEGTAESKRKVFLKSHRAIKGDWKKDKYSPNMLALKINW